MIQCCKCFIRNTPWYELTMSHMSLAVGKYELSCLQQAEMWRRFHLVLVMLRATVGGRSSQLDRLHLTRLMQPAARAAAPAVCATSWSPWKYRMTSAEYAERQCSISTVLRVRICHPVVKKKRCVDANDWNITRVNQKLGLVKGSC